MVALRDVEKKYKQADQALYDHDPGKAARLLQELVEIEPREPLFHWSLGYALSELKEYRRAIPEFRQALKLDPQNVAALGCLGRAYMELGEWEKAEKAIRDRLALKKSPQHYVFLAHIMMETDRYATALECCRNAIDLDSSFAEAFLNLGLVYRHEKRWQEAIRALQKAVELDTKYAVAFREPGLTYYSRGKFDLAKKALEAALALNRYDAWGHLYLAFCLSETGDFNGAATHFAAAMRADPENQYFKKKYDEFVQRRSESGTGKAVSKEPSMTQTVPIRSDANFLALDSYMDTLLQEKGYKRLERKRSISWVDHRIKPADVAVRFKLCYFGPNKIEFGVRREFVIDSGLRPDQIDCPDVFVILPSSVEFVGFAVQDDEHSRRRIAKVIAQFP